MKSKYLSSIHFLRGLAALAVCLFHFTNGNPRYLQDGNFLKLICGYGNYGVHVFFIISGLVIPFSMHKGNYKLTDFKKFLVKRVIRIEPPYLVSIVICILLAYLSSLAPYYRGQPFHIDIIVLLCHLGYLNPFFHFDWINPVYWTLAIEFQYYIIIALLFPLLSSVKIPYWISTIIFFNLIMFVIPSPDFIFCYSLFFSLGIILYKFLTDEIKKTTYYLLAAIMLVFIFFKFNLPGLIAALVPMAFIFTVWENKIWKFLGNISYSLYLLHVPIGLKIINLSENFFTTQTARLFTLLFALIITIAMSYLFYLCVELPFKNISHRIKYGDKFKLANA